MCSDYFASVPPFRFLLEYPHSVHVLELSLSLHFYFLGFLEIFAMTGVSCQVAIRTSFVILKWMAVD